MNGKDLLSLLVLPGLVSGAFLISDARGNGGGFQDSVGWTGSFSPRGVEDLEMLSEDLEIRFGASAADVKVKYRIRNEGPARKVEIGFPCTRLKWIETEESDGSFFPVLKLDDYRIVKDGKTVASEEVEEGAPTPMPEVDQDIAEWVTWVESWQVSTLPFGANETSDIEVSFQLKYSVDGYSVSEDVHYDKTALSYTLSSAAAWKGPIGKGTVRLIVDTPFPEEFTIEAPRDRFTRNGNEYVWEFSGLEPGPADDLAVSVYRPSKKLFAYGGDEEFAYYEFRDNRYFLEHSRFDVSASSQLANQGENDYSAKNVKLAWDEKAWVEGAKGDGIGESLTLTIADPKPLHRIRLIPGYAKDDKIWVANNRVAALKVTLNGEKTFTVDLPDHASISEEEFVVPEYDKPVSTVKLEIAGVHRGAKYQDTAISHIALVHELEKMPEVSGAR